MFSLHRPLTQHATLHDYTLSFYTSEHSWILVGYIHDWQLNTLVHYICFMTKQQVCETSFFVQVSSLESFNDFAQHLVKPSIYSAGW